MLSTRSLSSTLDRMITLNRALDEAFSTGWTGQPRAWVPAVDLVEKKDAYVLYAELPGVDPSQVSVNFEQSLLTIRGAKQSPIGAAGDGEQRIYAAERVTGTFERSVRLPQFVDAERISAEFTNGVLTVTVPKAAAAQPRKIEIKPAAISKN
jgi:HSP20 family protein